MKTLWLDKLYAVDTPHLIVAIVGNKCDLEARREVPAEVCTPRHVTEHKGQAYFVAHTQATVPWYQPGRGTVCKREWLLVLRNISEDRQQREGAV